LSDGRLLARFVEQGGIDREDAFAALVERHGPMVLGVCRRMLGGSADVDDAFQATFLALARRAGSLRRAETVAPWLRVVAVRAAGEARRRAASLRAREGAPLDDRPGPPGIDAEVFELRAVLDEELERLPGRFREAIRLCELEGVPRRDAAERLGLAEGTLSSRLARGRSLLRARLARRGLAVGALGAALTPAARSAPLPESALRLALNAISTRAASGAVSEAVASLTEGVLAMLALSRWKSIVRAGVLLATLALGAGLAWGWAAADPPAAQPAPAVPRMSPHETARGVVVDESDAPVAGAEVRLNPYTPHESQTVTDARGEFFVESVEPRLGGRPLLALADGRRVGLHAYRADLSRADAESPIRVVVKPAREVSVHVADSRGGPVAGANVEAASLHNVVAHAETGPDGTAVLLIPPDERITWIVGQKATTGLDYAEFDDAETEVSPSGVPASNLPAIVSLTLAEPRTVRIRALDEAGKPVVGNEWAVGPILKDGKRFALNYWSRIHAATTGLDGVAVFDWLPPSPQEFSFHPMGGGFLPHYVAVAPGRTDPLDVNLVRGVPIRGHATLPDGSPAEGVVVWARREGDDSRTRDRTTPAGTYERTRDRTTPAGTYELLVAPGGVYTIWVDNGPWTTPVRIEAPLIGDSPLEGLDFRLNKGTLVHGVVSFGPDQRPAEGVLVRLREIPRAGLEGGTAAVADRERNLARFSYARTDSQGRYAIHLAPGTYAIEAEPSQEARTLAIAGQAEVTCDLHCEKPPSRTLQGRVIDPEGRPIAGAQVHIGGYLSSSLPMTNPRPLEADAEGRFRLRCSTVPMPLVANSPDGGLIGACEIDAEQTEVIVALQPSARERGILLDHQGRPQGRCLLQWWAQTTDPNGSTSHSLIQGKELRTDDDGRFTSPPLLVGREYVLEVESMGPVQAGRSERIGPFRPEQPGFIELGAIRLKDPTTR